MNRLNKLILVAFLCLFAFISKAQSNFQFINIQVENANLNYGDTLVLIPMLEYNNTQQPFEDTLLVGCRTIKNGVVKTNVVQDFAQPVLIGQGGGTLAVDSIRIPVNEIYFSDGGGHTVIVWPILGHTPVNSELDSTTIPPTVFVSSWLNQEELSTQKQAKIFPIPANDFIMIEKPEGKANIQIINIEGKVVMAIYSTETQILIPLDELKKGNYFLRYSDGNKQAEIHSFVKN